MVDTVYCGDSRYVLRHLPDESVHLTVTSPPYNVGIQYRSYDDARPHEDYMAELAAVWSEVWRLTVPGGRLAVNVAANGCDPYHALQSDIHQQLVGLGWHSRGWIIWDKGPVLSTAWGSWLKPSAPTLRDQCEFVLVYQKGRGPLSGKGFGDPDITPEEFTAATQTIWRIAPASTKGGNPCPVPFPIDLPTRCIKLYTYPWQTVLDPYAGGGTTLVAARTYGRHYIGVDLDRASCDYAAFALGCDVVDLSDAAD